MLPLLLSAVFLIAAITTAAVFRWHDQEHLRNVARSNCQQIEALKAVVRPDPFDAAEARQLLADLNIDPDSDHAKRLLESARRNNARERRELAPRTC